MRRHWKYVILAFLSIVTYTGCSDRSQSLSGYIEGEYTYIASGVAGTLFNFYVARGQTVTQGDLLYTLDPEPEKAKVAVARANILNLEAQTKFAKTQLERQKRLYLKDVAAQLELDRAQTDFESTSQQLAANHAQLIQIEWSSKEKTVYAPISGTIFDTFYRVGEKVEENHPVLAILAPINIKVLFYLPEESLSKVKLGQVITFLCDGCAGKTSAKISYISPEAEYTPPVIYSKDTRNKLVYLIRADMPEETAKHFHPGQPIDVYLQP